MRGWFLVAAVLSGVGCRQAEETHASAPAPAPKGPIVQPVAALAERGFVGVIVAHETVDLVPKAPGRIKEITVRLGDKVKRDDLVATLDAQAARQELAMAEAGLSAASAEFEKATLEAGQAHERAKRREPEAAGGDHLFSKEEVSDARYQDKLAGPRLRTARASVAEKSARVKQLRAALADLDLRAPFDGTVSARYVDPGAVVGPTTTIVRLINPDDLWVRFAMPEDRAGAVQPNQKVRVAIENLAEVDAVVEKVAPEVDAASRMVIAEAKLVLPADWKDRMRSGQVARVLATPAPPSERP